MVIQRSLLTLLVLSALTAHGLSADAPVADRQLDISYGPHPHQRLDLYWPLDAGADCPVVVFIHGGGLTSGDKADEDYSSVWKPFVRAGFAFATINYRIFPDSAWPAPVKDCAAGVARVWQMVAQRHGEGHPIFLIGHSSGAALVALLGADASRLGAHGLHPAELAGIIPMGSIMWDEEFETAAAKIPADSLEMLFMRSSDRDFGSVAAYRQYWPMRHINDSMPPYFFVVAEGERENPPVLRHARIFCDSARTLGVEAGWTVLDGRTHMSAIRKIAEDGDPAFAVVRDFIQTQSPTQKDH